MRVQRSNTALTPNFSLGTRLVAEARGFDTPLRPRLTESGFFRPRASGGIAFAYRRSAARSDSRAMGRRFAAAPGVLVSDPDRLSTAARRHVAVARRIAATARGVGPAAYRVRAAATLDVRPRRPLCPGLAPRLRADG